MNGKATSCSFTLLIRSAMAHHQYGRVLEWRQWGCGFEPHRRHSYSVHFVGSDLGLNCVQNLSADNKVAASKERNKPCSNKQMMYYLLFKSSADPKILR